MKSWKEYLKDNIVWTIAIKVLSIMGFIALMVWLNVKGLIGLLLGMFIMAYLIFSKNALLMWIVKKTNSNPYLEELERI